MGLVVAEFTISLDGFIAGPDDQVGPLFRWYFSGDTDFMRPDGAMTFKVSRASAELLQAEWGTLGAIVTGRRDFNVSNAWGGQSPLPGVPIFIVTHSVPQEWAKPGSPFTFVTEGVASALAQAQAVAGDQRVGISGSKVTQQALQAGQVDELHLHLVPLLLGDGIRLFEGLGPKPIELEVLGVVEGTGVTHLRYRVVK